MANKKTPNKTIQVLTKTKTSMATSILMVIAIASAAVVIGSFGMAGFSGWQLARTSSVFVCYDYDYSYDQEGNFNIDSAKEPSYVMYRMQLSNGSLTRFYSKKDTCKDSKTVSEATCGADCRTKKYYNPGWKNIDCKEAFGVGSTCKTMMVPTRHGTQSLGFCTAPTSDKGVLYTTIAELDPEPKIVVANTTGSSWNTYRFMASNEAIRLDNIQVTLANSLDDLDFSKFYLYNGDTKIGETNASDTPTFWNVNLTIPENKSVYLTVKADVNQIGYGYPGTSGHFGDIEIRHIGDVEAVGMTSGKAINASAPIVDGNEHYIFNTEPVFFKVPDSNATLTKGGKMEVFRFTITADENDDVVFAYGTPEHYNAAHLVFDIFSNNRTTIFCSQALLYAENRVVSDSIIKWSKDGLVIDFDFSTEPNGPQRVVIPAGETKTFYIKIATIWSNKGDYFRAELRNEPPKDVKFGSYKNIVWSDSELDTIRGPFDVIKGLPITGNTYIKSD